MRTNTLLAPILALSLAACSLYDPLSGQDQADPQTPDPSGVVPSGFDPAEADPAGLEAREPHPEWPDTGRIDYWIPLSIDGWRGTGLDLDSGSTDSWYGGPGECTNGMGLIGWDVAGFEYRRLAINDTLGSTGTDLNDQALQSQEQAFEEGHDRGILLTTDQGAVYALTDVRQEGPNDQMIISFTAERMEPGICDPVCKSGRFQPSRIGRVQVELDRGLLYDTSMSLCGTPSDVHMQPHDMLLEPSTISAVGGKLGIVPQTTYPELSQRPDPAVFALRELDLRQAFAGVLVVETDEGRVYKLNPLMDQEGLLKGIEFGAL